MADDQGGGSGTNFPPTVPERIADALEKMAASYDVMTEATLEVCKAQRVTFELMEEQARAEKEQREADKAQQAAMDAAMKERTAHLPLEGPSAAYLFGSGPAALLRLLDVEALEGALGSIKERVASATAAADIHDASAAAEAIYHEMERRSRASG